MTALKRFLSNEVNKVKIMACSPAIQCLWATSVVASFVALYPTTASGYRDSIAKDLPQISVPAWQAEDRIAEAERGIEARFAKLRTIADLTMDPEAVAVMAVETNGKSFFERVAGYIEYQRAVYSAFETETPFDNARLVVEDGQRLSSRIEAALEVLNEKSEMLNGVMQELDQAFKAIGPVERRNFIAHSDAIRRAVWEYEDRFTNGGPVRQAVHQSDAPFKP